MMRDGRTADVMGGVGGSKVRGQSPLRFTCVDSSVLDVLRDSLDEQAPPLDALVVEVPDELVPVAVDARRPQAARVHALAAADLDRKQTLSIQAPGWNPPRRVSPPVAVEDEAGAAGYLGAVGPQHHLLRLGFGEGVGHAVADVVGRVLVAPGESTGQRNKQGEFLLPRFREGMFELAKKEGGGGEAGEGSKRSF